MAILRLEAVRREIGTFVILDGISAAIAHGDRVGLVGVNGSGKTTLLRLAAGTEEPDGGLVARKRGLTVGLLSQEANLDAAFMAAPDVRTAVRAGAVEVERLERELSALEVTGAAAVGSARYADLRHRFEALDGYRLDVRVDEALSGLGFARDEWSKPPDSLSGGEQTRAALARLVVADPELLLLDEPTNHLDLAALEWLEQALARRDRSLLVASHDRAFLDAVAGRIWELRERRLAVFRGGYSAYLMQREAADARAAKDAETSREAIARERELVQRYRSHRKYAKMHEHERRLEALAEVRTQAPRRGHDVPLDASRDLAHPRDDLRRGHQRVTPHPHGRGTGVVLHAVEREPGPGDGHDALHHAHRHPLFLEDGPLLDVQLQIGADGAGDAGLGSEIADALELLPEPLAVTVARVVGVL